MTYNHHKRLNCGTRTRQCGGRCLPNNLFCWGDINGTVRAVEDSIKDKSIEHVYLIDSQTGEVRGQSVGDRYGVSIPSPQNIKGNVVTHNHPSLTWDRNSPLYRGQSLSHQDVLIAAHYDAKEIRAVTTAYRHSMSPQSTWPDSKRLSESYQKHYDRTVNDLRWKIAFNGLDAQEANAILWHEINKKVAKDVGLKYSRTWLNGARADSLRCTPGNKPCGKRCIPSRLKCKPTNPSTKKKIAWFGAGITATAMGTIGLVLADVKKNMTYKGEPLRIPPDGIPDHITDATYDKFQPGDLVRRTFTIPTVGTFLHYAVYSGKKDGEHRFFQLTNSKLNETKGGERLANEVLSDYELAPDPPFFSREEIFDRMEKLRGESFRYDPLKANCEHLARGIVTGKWESQQAGNASLLSRAVLSSIAVTALRLQSIFSRNPVANRKLGDLKEILSDGEPISPVEVHEKILQDLKGVPGKIGELCYGKLMGQYFTDVAVSARQLAVKNDAEDKSQTPPTDDATLADLSDKVSRLAYTLISRSYKERIDRLVSIQAVSDSILSGTFVSQGQVVGFTIDLKKQSVETWHPQVQKQDARVCGTGLSCGNSCINKNKKCNIGLSSIASPEEIAQLKSLVSNAFNTFTIGLQRDYMDMMNATGVRGIIPHLRFAIDRIGVEEKLKVGKEVLDKQGSSPFLDSRNGNDAQRNLLMDAYFASHHPDKVGNLSVEDVAAIRSYGRPLYYKWCNSILRGDTEKLKTVEDHPYVKGHYSDRKEIIAAGKAHINAIESALNKIDKHDGMVYRGLDLPEDLIQQTLKKGQWIENGFMSTTKDKGKMYPGNTVMEIRSRSGRDISAIEPMPNDEVLFNRATTLKLVSHKVSKRKGKNMYHLVFDEMVRSDSDVATLNRAKNQLQQVAFRILSRSYKDPIDRFITMDTPTMDSIVGSFVSKGGLIGFSIDLTRNKVSTWMVKDVRRGDRMDAFRRIQKSKCREGFSCGTTCISKRNKCLIDLSRIASQGEIRQAKQITAFLRQGVTPTEPAKPLSIRDMRKIASSKGVVRYSRMNKSELEAAIKAVDSPSAARQRLADTIKKKQAAEFIVNKNALSDYAKDWQTIQKIITLSGAVGAPALATAFLYFQGRPKQEIDKAKQDYQEAFKPMAEAAEQIAGKLNEKVTDKPAIMFIVGGHRNEDSYASDMKKIIEDNSGQDNDYRYLAEQNDIHVFEQQYQPTSLPPGSSRFSDKSESQYSLRYKSFLYHNAIGRYFDQRGGVLRRMYEGVTGQGDKTPRNQDAIELAAQLYATAKAKSGLISPALMNRGQLEREYQQKVGNHFPSIISDKALRDVISEIRDMRGESSNYGNSTKPINILAHGAGGNTAKEAIEILHRMGGDGKDIAKRINLVTLSTPSMGFADSFGKVKLQRNMVARNDPFMPFTGQDRTILYNVRNREPKTFLENKFAIEQVARYFDRQEVENRQRSLSEALDEIVRQQAKIARAMSKAKSKGSKP